MTSTQSVASACTAALRAWAKSSCQGTSNTWAPKSRANCGVPSLDPVSAMTICLVNPATLLRQARSVSAPFFTIIAKPRDGIELLHIVIGAQLASGHLSLRHWSPIKDHKQSQSHLMTTRQFYVRNGGPGEQTGIPVSVQKTATVQTRSPL